MPRITVMNSTGSALEVESAVEMFGERIARELEERYGPAGDGENDAGFLAFLERMKTTVREAREAMVAADHLRLRSLAKVTEERRRRDETFGKTLETFLQVRETVEALYGPQGIFPLAGVRGPSPRSPRRLLAQVDETIGLLTDPVVGTEPVRLGEVELTPADFARHLEGPRDELRERLSAIRRARRTAQETILDTREAIKTHDRTLVSAARVVEGLFRLAEADDLADRIRASRRRSAVREEPGTEPPAAEETSPEEAPFETPQAQVTEETKTEEAGPAAELPPAVSALAA